MNVYCITFPNGKRYVGVEGKTNSRKWKHSRSEYHTKNNSLVAKAIRKYGWLNCKFTYLLFDCPPELCYQMESEIIKEFNLQSYLFGYNQSSGGECGFSGVKMADEHRRKIGNAHRGKIVRPETIEKMRLANTGKTLSEETKNKISASLMGRVSAMKGKKRSTLSNKKTSESMMGNKNHFFGKKHSDETKIKMRKPRCKKI